MSMCLIRPTTDLFFVPLAEDDTEKDLWFARQRQISQLLFQ